MKWLKRISIWIIVSLSLQCLGLFYLDHYFLGTGSKVVTKKVVENQSTKSKNVDVKIPEKAENLLVSYDAKYLSYNVDEKLKIVNCRDGKIKTIDAEDNSIISFSEWLPDRNRMLLIEKKSNDESSNLVLYSYDVLKGEKLKVKDLAWGGSKPEVEDIQLSTLTGVTYVNVSSEGNKSTIYRIDRMGEITRINTIPSFVSNIALVRHEDQLVYEGLVYNKIYATGRQNPISIDGVDKLTLIGTDDDDNVYVGELKDNLVSKVYYGKTSEDTQQWKSVNLVKPASKNDLFISKNGILYQNDSLKGVLTEINSGKQTSYVGKLYQLYNKGVMSVANNKASFVLFK
ncbi:hypothetical protein LGK95_05340 [Clostridium algoriphilum]|uniref:hypothetical protein n=1 Tax=Clostridium algoriphilum TaxID=198347 RepID=UPI001CF1680C|nr:hypothetical protein [Clostridium algoriphilum]MCB2292945.1 hypothetical protein [Clostridium algoriphilum]